jgi:glutamate-ammonia-ligase adenylyltransferase
MPDPIRKIALSRSAAQWLAANPELAGECQAGAPFGTGEMDNALAGARADDEAAFKRRLRRLRRRVLLRTMARDLDGPGSPAERLTEVCLTMTRLAEFTIRAALDWLKEENLIVVGMGKLGGGELNVSSDIDLVFVHPEDERNPVDPQRQERTARKLIALLNEVTEDGFVFRVDMRLRPYGDSGALVSGFDALEAYFVGQGREWERYA